MSDQPSGTWPDPWPHVWAQVAARRGDGQAHPARTVVLLPFFQLQAVARVSAKVYWPSGFSPRLETTQSWSKRVGQFVPSDMDMVFDSGLDSLRAAAWLQRAGLGAKQAMLGSALVQAAHQLGALVAAVPPAQRPAWADMARTQALLGLDKLGSNPLMYEAAVARIALEWAVASRYATDVLFSPQLRSSLDALMVVPGLQANPLAQSLMQYWADISSAVTWPEPQTTAQVCLHAASHGHDEADRAAACVLQRIAQGHVPVALAAVDRVGTRRISATLQLHGVRLVDETGWKLSTTRAAASVMALLRAAQLAALAGQGADDALLDWLKHTCADTALVNALEAALRDQNSLPSQLKMAKFAIEFVVNEADANAQIHTNTEPQRINAPALLEGLRRSRPIGQWLTTLTQTLHISGQWAALVDDAAGRDVLQALHLMAPPDVQAYALPMTLAQFASWATDCLESASFKPAKDSDEAAQVVVLPLAQVLARPFAAMVIAGADEQRLPAAPEPLGAWTAAQRAALGLPSRDAVAAEQMAVWHSAMQVPQVDVLWRRAEGEQALQPSSLLQRWQLSASAVASVGSDPRTESMVQALPTACPQPVAGPLRVSRLSAGSYSDLRACPYRFFALRLLGLQDAPELDGDISKRDFGSWLHDVLKEFHLRRQAALSITTQAVNDHDLLDQCAADLRMDDSGFIPFAAAWPQVRSSYLLWLVQHEGEGWQFNQAELDRKLEHAVGEGSITLNGRLDRVDRLSRGPLAGMAYVLDYKTESASVSKSKTLEPFEDTQLAFYAALLGEDDIHAAYVNLAERDCKTTQQPDIMAARDALLLGITDDVQRIHAGHALPALGEGKACEYCAARGLCRKDVWTL